MRPRTRRFVFGITICGAAVFCFGWFIIYQCKPRLRILPNWEAKAENTVSFTLTNPTTVPYHYWIFIEFKTNHIWNISPSPQVMPWEDRKEIAPKQVATISVNPPRKRGVWRIAASCWGPPTFATKVGNFLHSLNLGWIADKLDLYERDILVPGPEMTSQMSSNQSAREGVRP